MHSAIGAAAVDGSLLLPPPPPSPPMPPLIAVPTCMLNSLIPRNTGLTSNLKQHSCRAYVVVAAICMISHPRLDGSIEANAGFTSLVMPTAAVKTNGEGVARQLLITIHPPIMFSPAQLKSQFNTSTNFLDLSGEYLYF